MDNEVKDYELNETPPKEESIVPEDPTFINEDSFSTSTSVEDFKLNDKAIDEIESIADYPEEEAQEAPIDDTEENTEPPQRSGFLGFITSDVFLNDAIRITLGLICLIVSKISFVPHVLALVLGALAVIICGIPVFLNALDDIKAKKLLSENVFITIAGICAFFVGYPADSVVMLLIADLGFRARDAYFFKKKEEVEDKLQGREFKQKGSILSRPVKSLTDIYTFAVLVIAIVVAVVSAIAAGDTIKNWLHRALILLVAAAPCAVTYITTLTYKSGIGGALDKGIAFGSADSVKSAAKLTSVIFNKTGTITEGNYKVSGIFPVRLTESQLLYLAAYAEAYSDHPLARAITEYAGITVDRSRIAQHREEKGIGSIVQLTSSEIISVGSLELMERLGIRGDMIQGDGTSVYVAVKNTYVGRIDFADNIKIGAREAVADLRQAGIANIALMTGGNSNFATKVGREVGITEVYADYTPKDKYDRVHYILNSQERDDQLAYVTSAGSDISAAKLADVGIVLGGDLAEETNGVVVASDDPDAVSDVIRIAKTIAGKVMQNTILMYAVKAVSIILGLCGIFAMFEVVLLDLIAFFAAGIIAVNTGKSV